MQPRNEANPLQHHAKWNCIGLLRMRLLKQLDSSPSRLTKKNLTNTSSQFSRRCDLSTIGLIPDPLLSPSCHQVQVHSDVFSPIASYPGFSSQDFISKSEDVMAPLTHLPTHNSCKGLVTSSTWCMCLPCCLGRKKSALANSACSCRSLSEKLCRVGLYTELFIPTLFLCFLLICYPYIFLHFQCFFYSCMYTFTSCG